MPYGGSADAAGGSEAASGADKECPEPANSSLSSKRIGHAEMRSDRTEHLSVLWLTNDPAASV